MKFLKNFTSNLMLAGYGVAGGAVGRLVTKNVAGKIPYLSTMPKVQPALSLLAGAALMDMKGDLMHYGGHGMASVAGVDVLSGYVPAIAYSEPVAEDLSEELAEDLADMLEERLNDDVSNAGAALNDDVSNAESAMNGGDDMNEDLSEDLNGSEED